MSKINKLNRPERERESKRSSHKKKIIWALYDDAYSSYKKAIKEYFDGKFIVYSIGINDVKFIEKENYFYKPINLSITNIDLIDELSKLPKPDMILASPPCECWSGADCNGRIWKSINNDSKNITTIKIKNYLFYDVYNKKCHKNKKRFFYKKVIGMLQGIATITATIQIIEKFKPNFWFIENPKTSMIWKWIKSNYETKPNFLIQQIMLHMIKILV